MKSRIVVLVAWVAAASLATGCEEASVDGVVATDDDLTRRPRITGLTFPSNGDPASDLRIVFDGATLPSRTTKTVIWSAKFTQQDGYYAWAWDSPNTGQWDGGAYSIGSHPYPCDGAYDAEGLATGGTGSAGSVHYYEIAGGDAAVDQIASPGGTPHLVTTGVWLTQAITDELITVNTPDDTLVRTFYVDLRSPGETLVHTQLLADLPSPPDPAFYFGASDWRSDAGGVGHTDEAASGTFRNLQIYGEALPLAELAAEARRLGNTPVTAVGAASVWYSNVNPTPNDLSDRSGEGHHPVWANANRPALFIR